jgi:DNA-binding NarL/FixJ family response regulator
MKKKKILVIDDEPMLVFGLTQFLNQQPNWEVCCVAHSPPAGLAAVEKCKPSAVIMEISLANGSGLDLIKDIHRLNPHCPILVFSLLPEELFAERVVRAGAKGFVPKNVSCEELSVGLQKVLSGSLAVRDELLWRMIERGPNGNEAHARDDIIASLTDREFEVFRLTGQGRATRAISEQLGISFSTVETYRSSLKKKMGLANSSQLMAEAGRYIERHLTRSARGRA